MSLERKDVRLKLDPDMHRAVSNLSDRDQLDIAEWVEKVVVAAVLRRAHAARLDAEATAHLGTTGIAAGIIGD